MATTLALAMRASLSAGDVTSGANQCSSALDRFGKQARKTASDVAALKNIEIGKILAGGIARAADMFSQAGRSAATFAAGVSKAVDQLNDLSERTGISVQSLQTLQMAAKLSGIDDVTGALQKMTIAIGNAAESGNTDAFTRLGLDFQQLQAMSPDEQFRAIQQAIAGLATPAEQAAAAVALFGRSGVELLPMMNQNLEEIEARMQRLGAVVGADQVEAIGSMNDALDMVSATIQGIIGNVVGNLAPVVESLADDFLTFVESFNTAEGAAGGIAGTLTDAVLSVADYLAGVFDNAIASFSGFGTTMTEVGAVFSFVGNIFTAIAETLRAAFNIFQVAGNLLAVGLGKFLEGIGSWISSDLEAFGKGMAETAAKQAKENAAEGDRALKNAGAAATRAVFGEDAAQSQNAAGPAARAVASARQRMNDPEAKAERERQRKQREEEAKAAQQAAAADAKARKDAAEAAKKAEKAAAIDEKMVGKQEDIAKIEDERARSLSGKSNEALKANDLRSGEGMAQFLALATGREDPAIEQYRKQTEKLEEIRKELRALQQEKVEILGAAA